MLKKNQSIKLKATFLMAVLALGLGSAAWLGRELYTPGRWSELRLTRAETVGFIALVAGIVALNLPIALA